MLLVTHFDKNFFDWFLLLRQSIETTNKDINLFVMGTNLTDHQIEKIKETKVKNVYVKNHDVDFDGIQERRDGNGKDATWKVMMQCNVTKAAVEALEKNPFNDEYALITNADMLFIKPVINIIEDYANSMKSDVLLHFTKDHIQRKPGQIQNTTMMTKISKECIDFFKRYDEITHKSLHHYVDQEALLEAFNEYKEKITFTQLPTQMIDGRFNQESFILSAHAGDRNRNKEIFKSIIGFSNQDE